MTTDPHDDLLSARLSQWGQSTRDRLGSAAGPAPVVNPTGKHSRPTLKIVIGIAASLLLAAGLWWAWPKSGGPLIDHSIEQARASTIASSPFSLAALTRSNRDANLDRLDLPTPPGAGSSWNATPRLGPGGGL